jgi:predicted  nucleic acid-binding Zn-ribbon protein
MAFDFLGTLSLPQLQELRNFIEEQIQDIDNEIHYLYTEVDNLKQTLMKFLSADKQFGGNMESNIENIKVKLPMIVAVPKQDDSVSSNLIFDIKKTFMSTIKHKKERNEYKIKKLIDAIEQNNELIDRKSIAKSQTVALFNQIEGMFNTSNSNFLFQSNEEKDNYSQGIFNVTQE